MTASTSRNLGNHVSPKLISDQYSVQKPGPPEHIPTQNLSFLADCSADTAGYLTMPIFIRDFFPVLLDVLLWPKKRVLTMYLLLTKEPCGKVVRGEDSPVTSGTCRVVAVSHPRLQRPCTDQPGISLLYDTTQIIFRPHSTPAYLPLTSSLIQNHRFVVLTQDECNSLST